MKPYGSRTPKPMEYITRVSAHWKKTPCIWWGKDMKSVSKGRARMQAQADIRAVLENTEQMDPELNKIVNDNFWDLI